MENNQMKKESDGYPSEVVGFYLLCKGMETGSSTDATELIQSFEEALCKSRYKTLQILVWACDNRIGLGSDKVFSILAESFISTTLLTYGLKVKVLKALIRICRWDLVVSMLNYKVSAKYRITIFNEIKRALKSKNIACAKAMPRNGYVANRIRGFMKMSPKTWRQILIPICSDSIIVLMSANKWNEIDYNSLPTNILVRYYKAIRRHDKERFLNYLDSCPARAITINRILNKNSSKPIMTLHDVLTVCSYFESRRKFK